MLSFYCTSNFISTNHSRPNNDHDIFKSKPEYQSATCIAYLFLFWSLGEVLRYPHYVLVLLKNKIKIITWIRYHSFLILYPIGCFLELAAYQFVFRPNYEDDEKFSKAAAVYHKIMNLSTMLVVATNYQYMMRQRRKKYGRFFNFFGVSDEKARFANGKDAAKKQE